MKPEKKNFKEALNMNQPLAEAYYLKEELGMVWKQATEDEATYYCDGPPNILSIAL